MQALLRVSTLGLALALAGCDDAPESKADEPQTEVDADEDVDENDEADEDRTEAEPAGAAHSSRSNADLYEPFVDESRRAQKPQAKATPAAPAPAPRVTAPDDGADQRKPPSAEMADRGAGRSGGRTLTTEDGRTLKVVRGGGSSGRLQVRPK
jgi:hypothetical protein